MTPVFRAGAPAASSVGFHPGMRSDMTTPSSTPDRRTFLRTAGTLAGGAAFATPAPTCAADDTADNITAA